jgi:hypothetical protein
MMKKSSAQFPLYRNSAEPGESEIMDGNSPHAAGLQKMIQTVAK